MTIAEQLKSEVEVGGTLEGRTEGRLEGQRNRILSILTARLPCGGAAPVAEAPASADSSRCLREVPLLASRCSTIDKRIQGLA